MTEKDYSIGGSNTRIVTRLGKVFNDIESYREYYWSQFTDEYKSYYDRSWWKNRKEENRYEYGHNAAFDWLNRTYKGFSKELIQQALTEIKSLDDRDVLEVPADSLIPILNTNYRGIYSGDKLTLWNKAVTFYRAIPVYVIRRFLRKRILVLSDK